MDATASTVHSHLSDAMVTLCGVRIFIVDAVDAINPPHLITFCMDRDTILFLEKDVCDGSAFGLKWGTLILYQQGLVFHYNRPMKDAPGRMQDVMKLGDILEVKLKNIDWLVSKIFWVGRNQLIIKTREGEKRYYMRDRDGLAAALKLLKPSLTVSGP